MTLCLSHINSDALDQSVHLTASMLRCPMDLCLWFLSPALHYTFITMCDNIIMLCCTNYGNQSLFYYLILFGFLVTLTPSGSYGDFQLLLVEEDPTCTNMGIFACTVRTTVTLQVSWMTSPHETFCSDWDSNPCSKGLSSLNLQLL
jgi:hypothetical protein